MVNAQSWQWGKRGGGSYNAAMNGGSLIETAYSIALDKNGNLYALSVCNFTYNNVNVDGTSISGRGSNDIVVSSFKCDGTYRWSKVIGTNGSDYAYALRTDTLDGVYIAGYVNNWNRTAYFSSDTTIPSTAKQTFVLKYDTAGSYKWLRRPQPDTAGSWTTTQQTGIYDMDVDGAGNCYVFATLARGLYGGVYSVSASGSFHLLKYDRNGNFISGHQMAITMPVINGYFTSMYVKYNPTNGKLLIGGEPNAGGGTSYFSTTCKSSA
jgi:hypothetical protein